MIESRLGKLHFDMRITSGQLSSEDGRWVMGEGGGVVTSQSKHARVHTDGSLQMSQLMQYNI